MPVNYILPQIMSNHYKYTMGIIQKCILHNNEEIEDITYEYSFNNALMKTYFPQYLY